MILAAVSPGRLSGEGSEWRTRLGPLWPGRHPSWLLVSDQAPRGGPPRQVILDSGTEDGAAKACFGVHILLSGGSGPRQVRIRAHRHSGRSEAIWRSAPH